MKSLVEVAGLTKSYGRKRGVIDLSFDVAEGEVFGFLGPNGAGKTTTIRLLMGLLFANSGEARIAGLDCWRQSVQVKRLVGYLPGELALDPDLTGGQILAYFANLRGGVDKTYLKGLVAHLGLDTSRRFRHYSHGNKQKVGLIQAFMHRPRLLMLDEPTSGLDPLNQHEFNRMVAEVRAEGRTVFLSSHILSEVESMCDRVGIIREGRLVRVGGVVELKDIKRHEVELTFAGPPPADAFRGLAGLERVQVLPDGRTLHLTLQGGIDAVVKTAAQYPLVNFVSREPSLEDIFLRYYQGDSPSAQKETGGVVS
jgi:ABC-type multidrug transport system ATPase subunit